MIVTTLVGRLGRDVEVRNAGGNPVANFPVAVNVGFGERQQTLWFDCALWGKRAESKLIDYLKKGTQVAITGEQSEREHEGKVYKQLRVNEVTLCGGKGDDQGGGQQSQPAQQPSKPQWPSDDGEEAPF